ncbi:MAG: pyruvate formate-lyase-activating protein [Clostridia bacterium]|nr:pyruvate formate-lyase-activating protein [Clostridia bacterium]
MNSLKGRIHSTESFGTVDGPGIRFVVFMQGCPMRCLYCHNPDTWDINGGKETTAEELMAEFEKSRIYTSGGITVTGGEPLLQIDFVTELFTLAKKAGVHTCLDTSGITFDKENAKFDRLVEVTDLVMLDIKHIDSERHKVLTSHSNENILDFAKYLEEKNVPVWIRHVVVPGITDREEYLFRLGEFLGTLKNIKALDVLPYHTMGRSKYENLGIPYPLEGIEPMDKQGALAAREIILNGMRSTRHKGT